MALAAGTRIGLYEIVAPIGAGGMGEVYRAHDTKLRRDVAIKVLPPFLANDPDSLTRFGREARLLAALNHPRIATIHGFEEANGVHALVMELVEGPTLADRLAGSRNASTAGLSIADALKIAGQVAEAVEAAHDKGIVHRDLKPANVKLGLDGNVKVLDFGVAKALSNAAETPDLPPTITATEFRPGSVIGTPAYMSPEQARGQAIDKRTDIWAFGCVLFEMLTGGLAFPGDTTSDRIAAVLERQPKWDALPASTPASIRRLLRRCLEKDPIRRLHDIADARIEIDDARAGKEDVEEARVPPSSAPRSLLALGTAVALTALIAAAAGAWWPRAAPVVSEVRLELTTPPTTDPSIAISPDGRTIVFVGRSGRGSQLWLRTIDSSTARPLAGTFGATRPFWSPDGRSLGFFADVSLKTIDIESGSVKTLVSEIAVAIGGTWNRDGTILFADSPGGPIRRTSAEGMQPVAATRILPRQRGHYSPTFLPDGRHFLYFAGGTSDVQGVYVGLLDSPDAKRLFDADTPAVYSAAGQLLFVRQGHLLAQAFDPDRLELKGSPFPTAEGVTSETMVSAAGDAVIYRTAPPDLGQRQLLWVDRSGRETDKVVYPDTAALGPALSPDGRRIAVYRFANSNMDIWTYEARRRAWDRITFHAGDDIWPVWSPDGASIFYGSGRNEGAAAPASVDLYRTELGAAHGESLLLSTPQPKFPLDVSPDGSFLLFETFVPKRGLDLWALPLKGDHQPFAVVDTEFSEGLAKFSPDGKWIAYQSNKSGQNEIYVRPFPGPGADVRVSTEGGAQVLWNANGKELFYIGADDRLMAVPIHLAPGAAPEIGNAVGLFVTRVGSTATNVYKQQYVVASDGQSFVLNSTIGDANASPISVILNWSPAPR
jgi:serine/threonine protein kinase